jgi:chitinase
VTHVRTRALLRAGLIAVSLSACAGNGARTLPPSGAQASVVPARAPGATEFVGFWESWSDRDPKAAFYRLGSVPKSVTTVDVAFSLADGNTIAGPQNGRPLEPGARAIHARGGKVLLSFGGATSHFGITNPASFVGNLKAYVAKHPGLYDGFDFDDERIQTRANGRQQLIAVILATRAAFPNAVISFDAVSSGADPHVDLPNYSGQDRLILQKAGGAIDYVNVMDYDQFGFKPSTNPHCSYATAKTSGDCYLDIVKEFAAVPMPDGSTFPKNKIVMGLLVGKADDPKFLDPQHAASYARWVVQNGYRGIMIWDLDLDNARKPPNGSGYPNGTYVAAIAGALGN